MKVKLLVGRDRIVDNMLFYGESCLQLLDLEEIRDGAGVFSPALLGGADWRLEGISYSVWLSLLRTKDMSEALRNKVLREAIPREKLYSRDATEAMLNLRAKLCDINTLPLSQSEWETGTTVDVKVNGFTNIPVGYAGVQDPNPSVYKETQWVELIDQEMIRKNHFKAASEWFVEQTYGYAINQSEKPFTGQSVSYRSITSDKVNRKSPNFFSQRGIKSYLKGQEGAFIPQRTREILEAVGNVQSTKGETHGQVRLEDERARPGERLPAKRRKPRRPGRQSQFAKSD